MIPRCCLLCPPDSRNVWKFSSPSSGNKYLLTASLSNLSPFSNLSVSFSAQRTFPSPETGSQTFTSSLQLRHTNQNPWSSSAQTHTCSTPPPAGSWDAAFSWPTGKGGGAWLWQSPFRDSASEPLFLCPPPGKYSLGLIPIGP